MFYLKFTATVVLAIASILLVRQDPEEKKQDDDQTIVVPSDDTGAVSRRDFMRTKLRFSQEIFEGLTTGDLKKIDDAIDEVQHITTASQWVEIDNDFYRKLTQDFKTSTKRLKEASKTKNLDAIALRFYNMSTNCIDCHKHIRQARYEF